MLTIFLIKFDWHVLLLKKKYFWCFRVIEKTFLKSSCQLNITKIPVDFYYTVRKHAISFNVLIMVVFDEKLTDSLKNSMTKKKLLSAWEHPIIYR